MTNGRDDTIKIESWKNRGYDADLKRPQDSGDSYWSGEKFDARLDELMFNRVIQFKNLDVQPQGNDEGKIYYDKANKKLKMWVGAIGKWVDVNYTSTSTSTTSSSSSSTSTTSTSSSTSTTSSSSSTSTTSSSSTSTSTS